ncbi:MAG: glycosyltransferase [Steroidobacteraceae bacterium]
MYLVAVSVPIYVDGADTYVPTDWSRSLHLLRDSLQERYGEVAVVAPFADMLETQDQLLEPIGPHIDGIRAVPTFHQRPRTRKYWLGPHFQWRRTVADLLDNADVIHSSVIDAFQPYCYAALRMAHRRNVKSVFVLDQDVVLRIRNVAAQHGTRQRLVSSLQARLYQSQCRTAVSEADLCFMKGRTTLQRYGHLGRFVRHIEDTSYITSDIVGDAVAMRRVEALIGTRRPVRFCYCGRLHKDKGIDASIRLLAEVRAAGRAVEFHIYGTGPEKAPLAHLAESLGMSDVVHFRGARKYGPELLRELSDNDLLIFTPRIDETPRMIFDGYAAGLPLVGSDIDYVRERSDTDGAGYVLARDERQAVSQLLKILEDSSSLREKTARAVHAAHENAADIWYARRAEWTREAIGPGKAERRATSSCAAPMRMQNHP